MMILTWWKRSLMVASIAAFAVLASRPWQVRSAEPVQNTPAFKYRGSEICSGCHQPDPGQPDRFKQSRDFIRFDESIIWRVDDKHSFAYDNLTTARGRRMQELLHVADVTKPEAGCLGCHSASVQERENRLIKTETFKPNEGVSCENCHGPYSGWADPHLDSSFRTLPGAQWKAMGFVDLRTPAGKAEKCLSCHIGNVDEGKVVTHEMYAAGHPPLPSIEVATFTFVMPRHWKLNSERDSEKGKVIRKSLGYEEGQLEQTKLAMVSAAVALKTSLKLLADETQPLKRAAAPGESWPDYARFDCWSCHHDLKRDGWRQARGFKNGPPGRVPVSEWPLTLVELGIDRLALANNPKAEELRKGLVAHEQALLDQANDRPFGRKVSIGATAKAYAIWTDTLIEELGASKFDKDVAMKLLRKLVEKTEESTPDYDSARHVGWTIKLFVDDIGYVVLNRAQVEPIIDRLDAGLKLTLPSGQYYKIEDQIGKAFEAIGDYDPATFKAQLGKLLKALPPE
jgi:Cytochrome c554 and c-prime